MAVSPVVRSLGRQWPPMEWVQMPTGTYFGFSSLDIGAMHAKVQKFADPLSPAKPAAIFAGEIKDGEWSAFLYLA